MIMGLWKERIKGDKFALLYYFETWINNETPFNWLQGVPHFDHNDPQP